VGPKPYIDAACRKVVSSGKLIVPDQHQGTDRLWATAWRVDGQARVKVKVDAAVGIDVTIDQRGDASAAMAAVAEVPFGQPIHQL
jgi:hypothetical protein